MSQDVKMCLGFVDGLLLPDVVMKWGLFIKSILKRRDVVNEFLKLLWARHQFFIDFLFPCIGSFGSVWVH